MQDDFELLDAWAGGDMDAGRALLQRHTAELYVFFARKLDGPIEDLVQDTLLGCIEGRDRFRRDAGFRAYLFGIARNVFFGQLRAQKREHDPFDPERSSLADLGPTPSQLVARKREEQILLAALRRLPVETQVLFELYHWEKLSATEIGAIFGLGEPAVRSRLRRATQSLREAIAQLAESPALLHSTWADFEGWARALPKVAGELDETA